MKVAKSIKVGDIKGEVVIELLVGDELIFAKLDPETARVTGENLAKSSYKAKFGVDPNKAKSYISDQVRERCVNRAVLIHSSMKKKGHTSGKILVEIVDQILAEV